MNKTLRGLVCITALAGAFLFSPAHCLAGETDPWPGIRGEVFGKREISETAPPFALYAPAQAADAALVPVSIHLPAGTAKIAKSLTLVIDRNPAPIAATFTFGEAYRDGVEVGERIVATRVRVDSFSKVRGVLETTDGKLYMVAKFVAGAGGCSALPSKDPEQALANLGKVRVKVNRSTAHDAQWRDGVVMVRHPNFTGFQMSPTTGTFTPARFVDTLEIKRGDKLLMSVAGGISLSEDPNIRIVYAADGDAALSVAGSDSEGATFSGTESGPAS